MSVGMKKPVAIVLDVTGPLVTKSFMTYSQETRQFLLNNYREYVREVWGRTSLRLCVNFFRQEIETDKDSKYPPLAPVSAHPEEQMEAFLDHLKYRLENTWNVRSAAVGLFHLGISDWAYKKGLLQTPVYPEVKDTLTHWKHSDGIKLYVNVGPTSFLRNVFSQTTQGNLLPLIDGHMNLLENRSKNFNKLVQLLDLPPEDILFITRMAEDAKLALKEQIRVAIIVREDFAPEAVKAIKGTGEAKKTLRAGKSGKKGNLKLSRSSLSFYRSKIDSDDFEIETKNLDLDYDTVTSGYDDDYDPSGASKLTTKDLNDFTYILKLDDLKWTH